MRRVLFCPSDKGTIQKVIVLPSNHSLHDDLILEELEVFKVCSLYFSLLSFFSSFTLIPFRPLNQRQGWEECVFGHYTKTKGRQTKGRVASGRWMFCSVEQCRVMRNMLAYSKSGSRPQVNLCICCFILGDGPVIRKKVSFDLSTTNGATDRLQSKEICL